jgi:hypothetical protein
MFVGWKLKGYATPENARRAADKKLAQVKDFDEIRYTIVVTDKGRFAYAAFSYPPGAVGWLLNAGFIVL